MTKFVILCANEIKQTANRAPGLPNRQGLALRKPGHARKPGEDRRRRPGDHHQGAGKRRSAR